MKHSISFPVFLFFILAITPVYAGSQTLTTYYPAPLGNYKNMTVGNVVQINSQSNDCTLGSNATIVDFNGVLHLCDANNDYTLDSTSLWKYRGGYLSPWASTELVSIGADAGAAGYALTVTGAVKVTGNTVLGTNGANVTSINGNAIIGGDAADYFDITAGLTTYNGNVEVDGSLSASNDLHVFGNSVLGTNDGNTTTINGIITLGSDPESVLTVKGMTIFNGDIQVGGSTTLNNSVTVNANASLNGNTTMGNAPSVCNGGANCGVLQLDCTTVPGKCYAAYAP